MGGGNGGGGVGGGGGMVVNLFHCGILSSVLVLLLRLSKSYKCIKYCVCVCACV